MFIGNECIRLIMQFSPLKSLVIWSQLNLSYRDLSYSHYVCQFIPLTRVYYGNCIQRGIGRYLTRLDLHFHNQRLDCDWSRIIELKLNTWAESFIFTPQLTKLQNLRVEEMESFSPRIRSDLLNLLQQNAGLRQLSINLSKLDEAPGFLSQILLVLPACTILELTENNIGSEETVELLSYPFTSLMVNHNRDSLWDFSDVSIEVNPNLRHLQLRDNSLNFNLSILITHLTYLESLDLRWNNLVIPLQELLALPHLTYLNVFGNESVNPGSSQVITISPLKYLNLGNIDELRFHLISFLVRGLHNLEVLILRESAFTEDDLLELWEVLKSLPRIKHLELISMNLGQDEHHLDQLISALSFNSQLSYLDLCHNRFNDDASLNMIIQWVKSYPKLTYLDLEYNMISDFNVNHLRENLPDLELIISHQDLRA